MNIILCHGYAHRLLVDGRIESAPYEGGILVEDWQSRSEDSMDLSGGDFELIRNMLTVLAGVFPTSEPRVPPKPEKKVDESPRGSDPV